MSRLDSLNMGRCKLTRTLPHELHYLRKIHEYLYKLPDDKKFNWLDIGCGNGKVISDFQSFFGHKISQVQFRGYDLDIANKNEFDARARAIGATADFHNGELPAIKTYYSRNEFDLVTLSNVAHELDFLEFSDVLLDMLYLCSSFGTVCIYDMIWLPKYEIEIGAVNLSNENIDEILTKLFQCKFLTNTPSPMKVPRETHESCDTFFLTIPKQIYPNFDDEYDRNHKAIREILRQCMKDILHKKMEEATKNIYEITSAIWKTLPDDPDLILLKNKSNYWAMQYWSAANQLTSQGE